MEADWSVEIGHGEHCIDTLWPGWINLQTTALGVDTITEAQHPALRQALLALNADDSSLFTTKCDTWPLAQDEIDPDEFAATREEANAGFASYIDILEWEPARFLSFEYHERRVRELTLYLRKVALQKGRVDVVLRSAITEERSGYGITLYSAGCGASDAEAYAAWESVLAAAVAATIATAAQPPHMGE